MVRLWQRFVSLHDVIARTFVAQSLTLNVVHGAGGTEI
jgi:hypothetical protein